ncbi:MAG: cell division topological specificity factor MinE [Selenomonadaceae bacterium]|nr:cell division topological specificity factor MinE [Schwartzia sp. (in: firmicutes)]MCR5029949.1 cell division topological specificity factor MinE [Selenomonadaceae bacterium]
MLNSLLKLFGGKSESSSEQAHKRLKFVLIHDRANVSPEIMEHIKNDIIQVISHYMEIDQKAMEISLENDQDSVALVANIPVNRMRPVSGRKR